MSSTNFSHLFNKQAANYAKFRPTYPKSLYDKIFSYAGYDKGDIAVDVATGNGQAANYLAAFFEKVVAIDSSREQIANAHTRHSNVEFVFGDCHELPFENNSIDLVTVAQALHWFELPQFYKEAGRVLKPGKVFSAWCYPLFSFPDYPQASEQVKEYGHGFLKDYWDERAMKVARSYDGMEPPENIFQDFQKRQLLVEQRSNLQAIKGYMASWSAYNTYISQNQGLQDPLEDLFSKLQKLTDSQDFDQDLRIQYPMMLFLAKKRYQ
eukprot:TRINITY_DN20011_c0_g1_i1.p2 TRINITY_DN20011_c0_g1~~TRINITY_DN20011_c0_g1_i1.p2  ORF type:complete len:266 (+),score=34.28 TRINITY_DN20011_c0_g1_i1:473-1270(+)